MSFEIQIVSRRINASIIKRKMEKLDDWESRNVRLDLRPTSAKLRSGVDPTVLVAIVGATGTGIGALITGLLQLLNQNAQKRIVLQTKDGSKLEVPANTSEEKIESLLKKLQDAPVVRILIP